MIRVVVPTAFGGILTGTTLAIARAAGETAPLLFTCALAGQLTDWNPTHSVNSIPLTIFQYSEAPDENLHQQAWALAFVLIAFVLVTSLTRADPARALPAQARRPELAHRSGNRTVTPLVTPRQPTHAPGCAALTAPAMNTQGQGEDVNEQRARPHQRRCARMPRPRRQAPRATTRRSPGQAARSSRRSSPPGRPPSARRSATRCSTARSARAPASPRSRTVRSTSARPTRRSTPDQKTACKNCVQIPWALSANVGRLQRARCTDAPESGREDDREDLPRPDHELERPGDQGAEQGRGHAEPEDHADLPLGRIRHDLQLHRLPLGRQRRVEVEGRQLDRGQLPGRHRRPRLRGGGGSRRPHPGRHHLRRRRVRAEEPHQVRSGPQQRRASSSSRACGASPRPRRRSRRCRPTTSCTS